MTELINLNKVRKSRARAKAKAQAVDNRLRSGMTKVQKIVSKLDAQRAQRDLDGKKRGD